MLDAGQLLLPLHTRMFSAVPAAAAAAAWIQRRGEGLRGITEGYFPYSCVPVGNRRKLLRAASLSELRFLPLTTPFLPGKWNTCPQIHCTSLEEEIQQRTNLITGMMQRFGMRWNGFSHPRGKQKLIFGVREHPSFGRISAGTACVGLLGCKCEHLLCSLWYQQCVQQILVLGRFWYADHEAICTSQEPEAWASLWEGWVSQGDEMSCSEP